MSNEFNDRISYVAEKQLLTPSEDLIDKYLENIFSLRGAMKNEDVRNELDEFISERGSYWMNKFDNMTREEQIEYVASRVKNMKEEEENQSE
jgi:hypothetical protein